MYDMVTVVDNTVLQNWNVLKVESFPHGSVVKNLPANAGGPWGEGALEKEMGTHSSILACEIPWTEESGGL